MRLAILLASYNRKELTLRCISSLKKAISLQSNFQAEYFICDDNSTDDTVLELKKNFNDLNITIGTGYLFWNQGMIKAYELSHKSKNIFDGYLLINDDLLIFKNSFEILNKGLEELGSNYSKCILIGPTKDKKNQMSYGGFNIKSRFLFNLSKVLPSNKKLETCDFGNGNFMFIPQNVIQKSGFINSKFRHGYGDFDLTYRIKKNGFKTLLLHDYVGVCENNKENFTESIYKTNKINERLKILLRPNEYGFLDHLHFNYLNFPFRLPVIIINTIILILSPKIHKRLSFLKSFLIVKSR